MNPRKSSEAAVALDRLGPVATYMLGSSPILKNDAEKRPKAPSKPRRRSRFRWTARRRRRVVRFVEFLVLCAAIVMASLMAAGRVSLPVDAFVALATAQH